MASNYKFSNEEMAAIKAARRETKDKRADARLKALELRAEGMELSEVSQATGFHAAYVSQLVAKYRDHGLEAISGNHYGGNHRNMSFEEEAAILAPFKARAEKGELVEISEIETAYQQAVGHSIGTSQIYYVLHRHGWRKVMPRSRHPKRQARRSLRPQKIKTTIGELKISTGAVEKCALCSRMRQASAASTIPSTAGAKKASDPAFHVTIFGNTGMPMVRSSR